MSLNKGYMYYLYEKYKTMNIAVKASLWFAICSILQKGISIITLPIFTRLMPTGEYGQYSIFQTWYNILILVVTLNVQSEIFNKGLIVHSEEKDKYTANQAGLLLVLTGIFLTIYLLFRNWINHILGLNTFLVLIMLAEILANAMVSLWSARKRFDYQYKKIVSLTLVTSILNPIVGVIAVLFSEDKAQARIVSNALVPIVVSLIILVGFRTKGKLFSNKQWWKIAVLTSLPLVPHYLSLILLNQSDKLMINHFCGNEAAAIYSVAHSAGLLMTIINTSINGSFVPWIYTKLKEKKVGGISDVTFALSALVMVCNIVLIWFAPEAIAMLAAPQYSTAVYCLVPIATSVFFFFIYTLIVDVEIYYGKNHYVAIASVCAAALNLFLNYIFIPRFGFLAAGYTTLVSYVFTMLLHCAFLSIGLRKMTDKIRLFNYKKILFLSIALVILVIVALVLYPHFKVRLIVAFIGILVLLKNRDMVFKKLKMIKKRD